MFGGYARSQPLSYWLRVKIAPFHEVLNVWTTVVEATQKDSQDEDTRFLANKNRQVY